MGAAHWPSPGSRPAQWLLVHQGTLESPEQFSGSIYSNPAASGYLFENTFTFKGQANSYGQYTYNNIPTSRYYLVRTMNKIHPR